MVLSNKSTRRKFDVINFAKNIISEIENVRSFDESVDTDTFDNFKVPNESRINAFFRLIGLPMFVSVKTKTEGSTGTETGLRHMSPGYSTERQVKFENYTITNAERIGDYEISKVLTYRENNLQKIENSIGDDDDLNRSMTLSLTFPMPITTNIPDTDNKIDAFIGSGKNIRKAYKKLFPLITSYREIWPKQNELAIPFTSKDNRKIYNTTELQRPFIETVVRIRLVTVENAGSAKQNANEKETAESSREKLASNDYLDVIESFSKLKVKDILENHILSRLLGSLEQLANKWVEIKKKQHLVAKQDVFNISIKTTSAKRSPFGKRVDVSTDLTLRKNSDTGNRLALLRKEEAFEELFLSLLPSENVVDADSANVNTGVTSNTAFGALVNEFSDLLSDNLEQIRKEIKKEEEKIKNYIQIVEQLRLEIDMMTGEFSGISVVDVVAVIASLFLIEKSDLLALLDEETIEIMKKDNSFKSAIEQLNVTISPSSAYTAVKNLESKVELIFKLFNSHVKIIENKELKSSRSGYKKVRKQEKTDHSMSERTSNK